LDRLNVGTKGTEPNGLEPVPTEETSKVSDGDGRPQQITFCQEAGKPVTRQGPADRQGPGGGGFSGSDSAASDLIDCVGGRGNTGESPGEVRRGLAGGKDKMASRSSRGSGTTALYGDFLTGLGTQGIAAEGDPVTDQGALE